MPNTNVDVRMGMALSCLRSRTRRLAVGLHAASVPRAFLIALLATIGAGACATSSWRAPDETTAAAHREGGPATESPRPEIR